MILLETLQRYIRTGWADVSDTWTYASADDPVFVITIPAGGSSLYSVGMKIKLTQTTVKYFIIVAMTDTTLTVYGGTDYDLVNASISNISVSSVKTPLGFPTDPTKWTVRYTDTTQRTPSATTTPTPITSAQIDVPIGAWIPSFGGCFRCTRASSGGGVDLFVGLTTSNNSFSDNELVCSDVGSYTTNGTGSACVYSSERLKTIVLSSKTTFYLSHKVNTTTGVTMLMYNNLVTLRMQFVCAYL